MRLPARGCRRTLDFAITVPAERSHSGAKYALCLIAGLLLAGGAATADAADATRALERQRLEREQAQEALQLRMEQRERALRAPGPRDRVGRERSSARRDAEARARQDGLHARQRAGVPQADPADDAGTRQAKAEARRLQAQRESARERAGEASIEIRPTK